MQKHSVYIIVMLLHTFWAFSQNEKMALRDGNDAYNGGKPIEAANLYKKSLKENQTYYKANFNLGDAYYRTAQLIKSGKIPSPDKRMTPDSAANIVFQQAAEQFEVTAKSISNADTIQKAWHNYGNAKLMQANYEDAILGYKKALRLNSKDEDARYNLAYAQKKLAEQQKNQNNKDDKKNQDQQDKQDKKEQDKKEQEKKDQQQKQQEQQPQMSKEQAEKMLNALKNDEKKLQDLRKQKAEEGQKIKIEKDW